ncbi:hypothetical protein TUSST3_11980 [Streptomyces sp. TUS-ST3]|uniref:hypothetical protein n=1 Tax=Streptomyces sp. TUS-ST3 TaxID=3025591 RepID=UPI0024E05DEB|nr:hypothetical protein [Streptomyces sp. TUS-ST3]GLP64579.1 hypothetical protein TUSST3_11980 [Streptomyces sp. TUS-ST3]
MTQNHRDARVLSVLFVPMFVSGLVLTCAVGHVRAATVRAPASQGRQAGEGPAARAKIVSTSSTSSISLTSSTTSASLSSSGCGPESRPALPVHPVRVPAPSPLPPPAPPG